MNIDPIIEELQKHDIFFRTFWDIGKPFFTEECPSAAIAFDGLTGEGVQFMFNPDFWDKLDDYSRSFVVCHEMLHVIFEHGKRFLMWKQKFDGQDVNICSDIVINETLLEHFKFRKERLHPDLLKDGCWKDTVFSDDPTIVFGPILSTEEYLLKLKKQKEKSGEDTVKIKGFDSHDFLDEETQKRICKEFSGSMLDYLPDELKGSIPDIKSLMKELSIKNHRVAIKPKWETIIKRWEKFCSSTGSNDCWWRTKRNYTALLGNNDNYMLPHEIEHDNFKKDKIDVYFFLDSSGSCETFAQRFFDAARSLNPKRFKVHLYCFDTMVRDLDIKITKMYGGGGTNFQIIADKVESDLDKKVISKYPTVFIITDGYGSRITPKIPEKYYWFLIEKGSSSYIPGKSHTFHLKNFS